MLEVAICDDQKSCINDIYTHANQILSKQNIDARYTTFLTGKKLLESEIGFDILFLDIEMEEMDGIEIGKKIRTKNEKCKIIMVTGSKDRFKDVFQFQAFRYVTKPIDVAEITEAIMAAVSAPLGTETLELYYNRNLYQIPQRDILYVRAFNGYTEFVVDDKVFRREESLKVILKELNPKLFFQISRQYVINMHAVLCVTDHVVKVGREELKISTRIRKEFEKAYMEYDVNYGKI